MQFQEDQLKKLARKTWYGGNYDPVEGLEVGEFFFDTDLEVWVIKVAQESKITSSGYEDYYERPEAVMLEDAEFLEFLKACAGRL